MCACLESTARLLLITLSGSGAMATPQPAGCGLLGLCLCFSLCFGLCQYLWMVVCDAARRHLG